MLHSLNTVIEIKPHLMHPETIIFQSAGMLQIFGVLNAFGCFNNNKILKYNQLTTFHTLKVKLIPDSWIGVLNALFVRI